MLKNTSLGDTIRGTRERRHFMRFNYGALFDRHPDAVLVVEASGIIVYSNPAAHGLLSFPPPAEEVLHYWQALQSDEMEMFRYYFRRAIAEGEVRAFDWSIRAGDLKNRELRVQLVPYEEGNALVGATIYLAAADRRADGAAEPPLVLDTIGASFIESHTDPILLLDPSLNIVLANPAFSRLLGWRKNQLEGFHILQCPSIPTYLVPQMKEFCERAVATEGKEEATMETIRVTDGGKEYRMLLSITPIRDRFSCIRHWAVHLRDITEKKLLEERLRTIEIEQAIEKELSELEHLKTVSQLAASISHEVRNPLTVTRGFMQILKDTSLTEEKRRKYFELSLEELDRAERIITDYLTFARPSLKDVELLELNRETERIIQVIHPYASMENIALEAIMAEEALTVVGDSKKLHQAMINILKNAIEASEPGGSVSIRLERRDGKAVVIVEDRGKGMDEEHVRKLGTPYYTTKHKGTGLGTMVAFSIFKAMQAEVTVNSAVGQGTRFVIAFPAIPLHDTNS